MIGLGGELRVLRLTLFLWEFGGLGGIKILCVWVVKLGPYNARLVTEKILLRAL